MAHDAGRGIDREGHDLLRAVVRDVLDVDAALGRHHEGDAGGLAVDQNREVEFLVDVGAVLDVEAVDLLSGGGGAGGGGGWGRALLWGIGKIPRPPWGGGAPPVPRPGLPLP